MSVGSHVLRVGLVTEDPYLVEQVRRVADAAGAVVVGRGEAPVDVWLRDVSDSRGPGAAGAASRRGQPPALVVRARGGTPRAPLAEVEPGGDVVELPTDAEPLLRYLASLVSVPRARTVGVLGARGGAGASTLAAALARAAVSAGVCSALVDLDAAGGGLDRLLGIEHEPGPRWADLRAERAGFPAEALCHALPRWHAVRVLSGDLRGGARPVDPGVPGALRALRSEHDLVVLDLPRAGWWRADDGAWAGLLEPSGFDVLLLVATCDVRSAAAAAVVADALPGVDVRLAVRGPAPGGLHPEEVAEAAGLPLAATMRPERGGAAAAERGEAPGDHRRGVVARTAVQLVADLAIVP